MYIVRLTLCSFFLVCLVQLTCVRFTVHENGFVKKIMLKEIRHYTVLPLHTIGRQVVDLYRESNPLRVLFSFDPKWREIVSDPLPRSLSGQKTGNLWFIPCRSHESEQVDGCFDLELPQWVSTSLTNVNDTVSETLLLGRWRGILNHSSLAPTWTEENQGRVKWRVEGFRRSPREYKMVI